MLAPYIVTGVARAATLLTEAKVIILVLLALETGVLRTLYSTQAELVVAAVSLAELGVSHHCLLAKATCVKVIFTDLVAIGCHVGAVDTLTPLTALCTVSHGPTTPAGVVLTHCRTLDAWVLAL